jgi:ATP-dependent RNA helicase DeaD
MTTFAELGLRPELLQAITTLGYDEPTPIQVQAIPLLLAGRDILGQAQTGTGKTAAFALPMLQQLDPDGDGVQGLILAPTRELASQVAEATYKYGAGLGVRVLPVYGGTTYNRQIKRLHDGVHVVVGTPGRILDLIEKGVLKLDQVRYLVLDEADEMLDLGFVESVEQILAHTPATRQTALFSATMPNEIQRLMKQYMRDPAQVSITHKTLTVPQVEQRYYFIDEKSKLAALARLLETEDLTGTLVFARTKLGVAELAEQLIKRGYTAEALHGDLTQDMREVVLRRFRSGTLQLLIATDVVARGVDIQDVSHVINYDIPGDPEDYVHRIGRTGRAGRSGTAITLVTPKDQRKLKWIESFTKQPILHSTLPPKETVYERRDNYFVDRLEHAINTDELTNERALVETLVKSGVNALEIAAGAMRMAREAEALRPVEDVRELTLRDDRPNRNRSTSRREPSPDRAPFRRDRNAPEVGMTTLKVNVGHVHQIRVGEIVGAIAGESGIPGKAIGAILLRPNFTLIDVEDRYVEQVLKGVRHWTVRGQRVEISRDHGPGGGRSGGGKEKDRRGRGG